MDAALVPQVVTDALPVQADTDAQLIQLWLHDRPASTQTAYQRDLRQFWLFTHTPPLRQITLRMLYDYADHLAGYAPATRARRPAVVKSLIAFAVRLGYLPFDVGRAIRSRRAKNTLAERIILRGRNACADCAGAAHPEPRYAAAAVRRGRADV